jgi:hypothetical protein
VRKFDIGTGWKERMGRERRTEPVETTVVRQRTQNDALRVADRQDRGRDGFIENRDVELPDVHGWAKRCPKRVSRSSSSEQFQRLPAGARLDGDRGTVGETLPVRNERRQTPQAVARQL